MSQSSLIIANSQVDKEVHDFFWNINNFGLISCIPNLLDQHVFPFTVGSSMDKVSNWKFFLAHDTTDNCPALYVQLVEYTGTDHAPVMLDVCIANGTNTEQFSFRKLTFLSSSTSTEPMKCNFMCYNKKAKSSPWVLNCLSNGEAQIFTLKSIHKSIDITELKLRIKFLIFGKYSFTTSGNNSLSSTIMEREQRKSAQCHKKVVLAMLESGDRSDVIFETRDNQRVAAHRLILSMQSTVFAAMFDTEMKEKTEGVVKLDDIGGEGLKIFLKFIYTGELDAKWGEFYDEIVNAANKYQVQSLIDMCQQMLPTLVSWENCLEILKLTELHDMTDAKKKVESFMKSNPDRMLQLLRDPPSSKRPRFT